MPKIQSNKFSIQSNRTYRISSEFLNILDDSYLVSIKNFFYSNRILVIGTVFSNKMFLFLKINYKMFLVNSFVENNELISFIDISNSGSKILIGTVKNNIFIYSSNVDNNQHNEKLCETLSYSKKMDFFNKNTLNFAMASTCFNNDETSLMVSYKNGRIRIFDLIKKSFTEISLQNAFELFSPCANKFFSGKIFGKTLSNHFIEYDIVHRKVVFTKPIENFLDQYNYIIIQCQQSVISRCYCHNKIINNITLPILCQKILLISRNKFLIQYKNTFFSLTIGSGKLYNFELDFYSNEEILKNVKKNSKIFISSNNCVNFILTIVIESTKSLFLKPVSEKHKTLAYYDNQSYNIGEVYDIKFFGVKNSIIVATNHCYLDVFESKNFYLKGKFTFGKSTFHKFEIRGNILIAINIIGQIIFWKIDSFTVVTWINTPKENISIFSLSKKLTPEGIFIFGGKDCILSLWKIFCNDQFVIKIELLYKSNVHTNQICLISTHKDGFIFATVSLDKKIFLWKKTQKYPYLELDKQKRSIWSLSFSPKDSIVAIGTSDGNICFFNFINGCCLKKLSGDNNPVTNCLFNSDGFHLYTSDSKGRIKIWKVFSGICINTIVKHKGYIWSLIVSENDTLIASSCTNGELILMKDVGLEISRKKRDNFQNLLELQKNINSQNFNRNFYSILNNIFDFQDSIILFDFLKFSYFKFYFDFENYFGYFIQNIERNKLKFLFRSLVSWNLEKKKLYLSQKFLYIVLNNLSPNCLQEIKPEIIDSLLITTYHVKQLLENYKKLTTIKYTFK
nr:transducin (beta) 3-like protein [Cryptomonas sp.]